MTKTVAIEETALSDIVDELKDDDEVVITENGLPVARVTPIRDPLRGPMYGTVTFHGDITEPLDEEWDADK
ncbi:MAG TPA: type II toxin-antitoxin system prevent-host-death family antitoxin [Thermoanaerobaculia bacterium]|nr:type II toxin-antitoxin system prevent-host-death family antitoxin [Thermoanaerobaculia bacterium]